MLRPLPPETFWTVTCIGRHHFRMLALALLRGAPGDPHRPRGRRLRRAAASTPIERAAGRDARRPRPDARARGRRPGAGAGAAGARLSRERAETPNRAGAGPERSGDPRGDRLARRSSCSRELGYHAASMRAIAAAAGSSRPRSTTGTRARRRSCSASRSTSWSGSRSASTRAIEARPTRRPEARRRGPRARRLPRPAPAGRVRHRLRDPRPRRRRPRPR